MSKTQFLSNCMCLLLLCSGPLVLQSQQTFMNPVADLADPYVLYHAPYYYYLGTNGNHIAMRRAETLEGLRSATPVTLFTGTAPQPTRNFWAPELHEINDNWYIYFTAEDPTDPLQGSAFPQDNHPFQRTYVLENTHADPLSPHWTFKGKIGDAAHDHWAVDGSYFSHQGADYFIWSGSVADVSDGFPSKPQNTYISRLSNPWTLQGRRCLISEPAESWEQDQVQEGPIVLKHGNRIFIAYSTCGCWTPNYKLGMIYMEVGDDPLDPASWTKHHTPIFEQDPAAQVFGPGHHAFFKSPDGTEDWIVYHANPRSSDRCGGQRSSRIQRVFWDGNGMPELGAPVELGQQLAAPSGEPPLPCDDLENGIYRIRLQANGQYLRQDGTIPIKGNAVSLAADGEEALWQVQAIGNGVYTLSSLQSGMLLEVVDCDSGTCIRPQVWPPNGHPHQQWKIIAEGGGWYRLESMIGQRVLTRNGLGNLVSQTTASVGNTQKWKFEKLESLALEGTVEILSAHSELAIDLPSCSPNSGKFLQQWTPLHNDCQRWEIEGDGLGFFRLTSKSSGLYITAPGHAGELVRQTSTPSGDEQWWQIHQLNATDYSIVSKANGLALALGSESLNPGIRLRLAPFDNSPSQRWRFQPVLEAGPYRLICKANGKVIDLPSCAANPSFIQTYDWLNNSCQKWEVSELTAGKYEIASGHSGKALGSAACTSAGPLVLAYAPGSSCTSWDIDHLGEGYFRIGVRDEGLAMGLNGNGRLKLEQDNGQDDQRWRLEPVLSPGRYSITSKHTGKVIDLPSCSTANRRLQQYPWLDNDCQKWNLQQDNHGYFRIASVSSGKFFSVEDLLANRHLRQQENDPDSADFIRWEVVHVRDGFFKIVSKASGHCLQAMGNSSGYGSAIKTKVFSDLDAQLWRFEEVGSGGSRMAAAGEDGIGVEVGQAPRVFPNPFSTSFTVEFAVPEGGQKVSLELIDGEGRVLQELFADAFYGNGVHALEISPKGLPSGAFFLRLRTGEAVHRLKVVHQGLR